jgi:hypothetical protein
MHELLLLLLCILSFSFSLASKGMHVSWMKDDPAAGKVTIYHGKVHVNDAYDMQQHFTDVQDTHSAAISRLISNVAVTCPCAFTRFGSIVNPALSG